MIYTEPQPFILVGNTITTAILPTKKDMRVQEVIHVTHYNRGEFYYIQLATHQFYLSQTFLLALFIS